MGEKNPHAIYLELLKYPVITISVLFGLVAASWMLGLDFSRITEVGPGGVKLAEVREDAALAAADLGERLDQALARIEALEEDRGPVGVGVVRKPAPTVVSEPSEAVARLSRSAGDAGTVLKGKRGYVWIGDYVTSTEQWERQNLLGVDDRAVAERPLSAFTRGSQYRIAVNTYVRDGLPENDEEYFRGKKSVGALPSGTLITLIGEPIGIDREFAVQYWAEVEVAE